MRNKDDNNVITKALMTQTTDREISGQSTYTKNR